MDEDERRFTPEKQLLKLIEGTTSTGERRPGAFFRNRGRFSIGALRGRALFFKKKTQEYLAPKRRPVSIKAVNRVLGLCTAVLAVYLAADVIGSAITLDETPVLTADFIPPGTQNAVVSEIASSLKRGPYYSERVRSRDIFKFGPRAMEVERRAAPAERPSEEEKAPSKAVELAKDLRLVGISWSDDPDVMIEDIKTNTTHFLKRGQVFKNMRLVGVFRDKVVLRFEDGGEVELK